jgi:hypothetical protein
MVVKKKPESSHDIDAYIDAGSATKEEREKSKPKKDQTVITVAMPTELLEEIDATRTVQKPKSSRTQWILKACYEALERQKQETDKG